MLELTYFQKTEKIGKLRFGTFVLIDPIRMKSVRATTGLRIDQFHPQVVLA